MRSIVQLLGPTDLERLEPNPLVSRSVPGLRRGHRHSRARRRRTTSSRPPSAVRPLTTATRFASSWMRRSSSRRAARRALRALRRARGRARAAVRRHRPSPLRDRRRNVLRGEPQPGVQLLRARAPASRSPGRLRATCSAADRRSADPETSMRSRTTRRSPAQAAPAHLSY